MSRLPQDAFPTFFTKYAEGRWNPLETPQFPAELSTSTLARLKRSHSDYTSNSTAPPDLKESVEEVYRSFLSDGNRGIHRRRASTSQVLLTPNSEISAFSFVPTNEERSVMRDDSASCKERPNPSGVMGSFDGEAMIVESWTDGSLNLRPDGYAAHAAQRYAKIGFMEPPMAPNEAQRRRALRVFKPFHQKLDPNLDRIARLGKTMFSTNASLISLVDTDQVQFTFNGRDPYMVPRGTPMCSHAILVQGEEPMVVLDTLKDWRFKGNKVVTDELSVRFYAGFPMRTPEGDNIGIFCVLDDKPRKSFTAEDRAQLKELAAMVMRELQGGVQQRQATLRDQMQLTLETFNREAVSGLYSTEELLNRAVHYISHTLSVEGVLILDAVSAGRGMIMSNERQPWHDRQGQPIPIMAASEHATALCERQSLSEQNSVMDFIFKHYPSGATYIHGDDAPREFVLLLPDNITAGAVVPISRAASEPFALVCVYTYETDFYFDLPTPMLSFLSAMGLIICGVQQKQVLSLADKAKVDFIANISHELRTPLHGVMASCDLLSETNLNDTQESFLSTAKQCASSLTETINHVLDFTKTTSQTSIQTRVSVNLAQLVEETMTGCWLGRITKVASEAAPIGELYAPTEEPSATMHKMGFVEPLIEIEPQTNWNVLLDKAGLRRILINLIGNSMKFTQEGYVKVGLYRGAQTDYSVMPIEIVVEDTGSGMSDAFIKEKLFHPFSQEKPFAQGVGLGLAIVRAILKSPGIEGTVEVQSQVGFGTRMVLRLEAPVASGSPSSAWLRNPIPPESNMLPSVALVGFDNHSSGSTQQVALLRQALHYWNREIQERPVVEAKLLIFNGDTIEAEKIREGTYPGRKMIILASSPVDTSLLKVAQELSLGGGFCLLALKPVGPIALSRLLSKVVETSISSPPASNIGLKSPTLSPKSPVLSTRASSRPTTAKTIIEKARRPEATKAMSEPEAPTEGKSTLRALVVEDNPVNRKVLAAYLRKRAYEFIEAENGEEGVKVFQSYPAGYFDICLMDLQMPVRDGFQATADIRGIETQRIASESGHGNIMSRLKVIALSGLASPEDKERASAVGFDGYLVKPVAFKTLDAVFQPLHPIAKWRTDS
ncbi:hypothetical protein CPB86DRAFT_819388 [Serendipita vermifera]|nr:hypothetical protein CPB86DRAFT_819388 [Serendipita vermifera]